MASINIDGKVFEVDEKNNLLQECLSHAMDLPYFCWHPSMGSVGSCRQCAVIEYANEDDEKGRLIMACMTEPREGARYSIEAASKFRAQAIESIMINHPHDCPVCEEGGECHLQDMTVMSGHTYRRYDGKKKTHNNQYLGPFINHEMNRCITCYRCVRYYKDYAGGTDFGPQSSHDNTYFGRWQEGSLESEFSGNLVEVCPTGVFTDKPFSKHYSRKWDLQSSPSVCTGCSVGCNTNPGERYGTLRRIVNRFNDEVNGYFLCDKGRFGAEYVNSSERIPVSMARTSHNADPVQMEPDTAKEALNKAAKTKGAIGIGSPRASMEANFSLRELVGEENFYAGIAEQELGMLNKIIDIYQNKPVNVANIKDIENSDAILILGEDLTNTAARLALGVRQSVKNLGIQMGADLNFPIWHDAAIRQLAMDKLSPLYILSPHTTRLDDVAKTVHISSAANSARIGMAIAHAIDSSAPAVKGLSKEEQALIDEIAETLKSAKQALIISGTNSLEPALLDAASNIATALHDGDNKANLALVSSESNSMGLALLMQSNGRSLEQAMNTGSKAAVVLENDLYRRAASSDVDSFIKGLDNLVVLDHLKNRTGEQANLVLATATFAESSGTFVNYEGRAQHYYSTFKPDSAIRSSALWLSDKPFNDITAACAEAIANCGAIADLTPGENYNFAGLKVPRQHHRYSGRTAMRADISVHEPKQEQDEDGVMVYSMEGVPAIKDASVLNSPWAPGWNSNQSLFKFQEYAGGPLKQGSNGQHLLTNSSTEKSWYELTKVDDINNDAYTVFPLYHLFGSEELSAYTPAIQEKATSAYISLNPEDAEKLGLNASDGVQVEHNGAVPFIIRESIQAGTVGVSVGLKGLNFQDISAAISLDKAADWQNPDSWRAANIIVSDKREERVD
ncbi:NADH-quinone oxidoreductase subunit NuoG [Haliea sp. AH-315-K21]|uniref:NADH-quinone oxidoreductase n=1 Tax=SAR86 cluster bacterium TaxID=2030880 RepID=A0A2A5C6Z4_9GAMM|nr:NADH-quinone oxidoreductase subunit NuoG [Haliea sp. AH-315-K21]PCJ39654.1 MAG: NADH-quinone oxidoreductase subunit G [SAR86 cluster bacterium]